MLNFAGRRGRQNKSIYVDTDDPQNRIIRLEFSGLVVVWIEVQPEGIHFGTMGTVGRVEREVLVNAVSTNTFHLLECKIRVSASRGNQRSSGRGEAVLCQGGYEGPRKEGSFMTLGGNRDGSSPDEKDVHSRGGICRG